MNARCYRADLLVCLLDGDAIAQAPNGGIVMRRPAWVFAAQIGRQPEIHIRRKTKSGREHTDNRVNRAVNLQVRQREILRRPEIPPPISVADKNSGASPL